MSGDPCQYSFISYSLHIIMDNFGFPFGKQPVSNAAMMGKTYRGGIFDGATDILTVRLESDDLHF